MTTATVRKLVARAGEVAKLSFPIHPHMLRHACGYKLASDGHDPAHYSNISGTRTSSTVCGTRNSRLTALELLA
jgi:site-specific recombinase XerD